MPGGNFARPSREMAVSSSAETGGMSPMRSADSTQRAQCRSRSGATPSKARAPSNTIEPSQVAWSATPRIGKFPSCQSSLNQVQIAPPIAASP